VNEAAPLTIITGAASGIGLATARRLAARGDRLVLADVAEGPLEAASEELRAAGADVNAYPLDVRDGAAVQAMVGEVVGRSGPVTYLFSNAGGGRPRSILDLSLAEWHAAIDTHVGGAYLACRAAVPHMPQGAILVTASDFAVIGYPGYAHYCAAKTALYSFAKSLALELAPNVRVNALGPGPIDTPHLRAVMPDVPWEVARGQFEAEVPMGRLGSPDEVAAVAEYLLSQRAAYMTGQLVQPNGGQVMW
jgi:NAD(P)-dependent dehydrogenase (short-subunit alcohol dehydrogenase family)